MEFFNYSSKLSNDSVVDNLSTNRADILYTNNDSSVLSSDNLTIYSMENSTNVCGKYRTSTMDNNTNIL